MEKKQLATGIILPRDYGISLTIDHGLKLFLSPLKYALGAMLLETKDEIIARVKEKAQRENHSASSYIKSFLVAVEKKEGSQNLIEYDRYTAICKPHLYGGTFTAQIKSKSKQGISFYDVQLHKKSGLEYGGAFTGSGDGHWGTIKSQGGVMTVQAAALDIALFRNLGIFKSKDIPQHASIPFTFFDLGNSKERYRTMTDALFNYYIHDMSMFEINKQLLDQPHIYSSALLDKIRSNEAEFTVLRQKEKTIDAETATSTDRKYWGAIKALEKRIEEHFSEKGFWKSGYALEFKNSPFEVAGVRYSSKKHPNVVYDVCNYLDTPPLIVKRTLDERATHWIGRLLDEHDQTSPMDRAFLGETFQSIDDVTRRDSYTTIIFPSNIYVTQQVLKAYGKAF